MVDRTHPSTRRRSPVETRQESRPAPNAAKSPALATPAPTLIDIRLGRTRDVLRELARSLSRALPIAIGIAGPIAIATFAMVAWAGLPVMKAPTMQGPWGAVTWVTQTTLAAWPIWALRRRLLPAAWCVQLRCLPIEERHLKKSDLAVTATILAPLAAAYAFSAGFFTVRHAGWWMQSWPVAAPSAIASWATSCALGAAILAHRRRTIERGHPATAHATHVRDDGRFPRASFFRAILWTPSWRGALSPGGPTMLLGAVLAMALAQAWVRRAVPAVPGAAWAFAFSALLLALTERAQRAIEGVLAGLHDAMTSWPLDRRVRLLAKLLPMGPMLAALPVLVGTVLGMTSGEPWRAIPLAGFALVTLASHAALVSVPSEQRETHVGLWAVGAGLATAFGSEFW